MNTELLDKIETLAGPLRAKTFRAAAEFIMEHGLNRLVETGCFRGCEADGNSTLILAMLAEEQRGWLYSFDNNEANCSTARDMLEKRGLEFRNNILCEDSVFALSSLSYNYNFAYLDSYDHDPANPGPCQRHELAEIGAVMGKMVKPCAILLDDFIPETGGKTKLGAAFLEDRGWKLISSGYQLLYANL